jgi:hypothetical protein
MKHLFFFGLLTASITLGAQNIIQMSYVAPMPPLADAGADTTVLPNAPVPLSATVTSGTGPFSYLWTPAAAVDDPAIPNPTATVATTTNLQLVVSDANGCSDTANVTIFVSGLGLADASLNLGISPNPGSGIFDISANVENGRIKLLNLNGQLLEETTYSGARQRYDWSALPDGLYLMLFTSGDLHTTQRIIIQK